MASDEQDTTASVTAHSSALQQYTAVFGTRLLSFYFTLAVPMLLTLLAVRLVMSPLYLEVIYRIPGFPEDRYGFTRDDRLTYAPRTLTYLLDNKPIAYLEQQIFPDGEPLYNPRELHHMEDVQTVTRLAFSVLLGGGLMTMVMGFIVWRMPRLRKALTGGAFNGAVLTLSLIGTIIVVAIVAWDVFFTSFHQVFFESGTWRFAYSDTLIRLFPEFFWFGAALTIGILATLGALLILLIVWRLQLQSRLTL